METPVHISPEWIAQHAQIAAWLLGSSAAALLAVGGYFAQRGISQFRTTAADVKTIKENHLTHIEEATIATNDSIVKLAGVVQELHTEQKVTNGKLDVLTGVIERKL